MARTSTAAGPAPRRNIIDQLEGDYERVDHLKKALDPAEDQLEHTRQSFWERAGAPFGSVKVGGLRFSRLMVIVGSAFVAGIVGSWIAPMMALLGAMCVLGVGFLWVRSKF